MPGDRDRDGSGVRGALVVIPAVGRAGLMTATATLEGVSKKYGRLVALEPTNLDLRPGVVGLLGPNGAGKTTMVSLLATVLPPTTGRITVAGHEVTSGHAQRVEARRRIGFLPQEVQYPSGMTVAAFVDYIAVLKEWKDSKRRAAEVNRVLELVDLGDRAQMKIRKLSGGQRRRLAVAQALIGAPELLLLDEPTTGLDPEQRASLRAILSGLPGTVLLSTHQTEDVAALCDRVIIIDRGAIHFDGSVRDLLDTAVGRVHVAPEPSVDAVASWKTGTGLIHSVGGTPSVNAQTLDPSVEDAYLLLRGKTPDRAARR
jgi:ABC-2 type transport system ATP-binding protein